MAPTDASPSGSSFRPPQATPPHLRLRRTSVSPPNRAHDASLNVHPENRPMQLMPSVVPCPQYPTRPLSRFPAFRIGGRRVCLLRSALTLLLAPWAALAAGSTSQVDTPP